MSTYDLAVIGGGPGGLAAAMRGMSVVAFEAESFGGQLVNLYPSKPVTNFPAQAHVLSRDLAMRLAACSASLIARSRDNTCAWAGKLVTGLLGYRFTSCPPKDSASKATTDMPRIAAYIAAARPPGPPPTTARS